MAVKNCMYSDGRTPLEIIKGKTPDVSEYIDFGFYDWVTYKNNSGLGLPIVCRWIGVSNRVGQLMSSCILAKSDIPVSCTRVQRINNFEKQTD